MILRRRHLSAALLAAVVAWLPFVAGCGGTTSAHPAVGRIVGNLNLVSLADPTRQPPTFVGM
jgi:hypothetical protein